MTYPEQNDGQPGAIGALLTIVFMFAVLLFSGCGSPEYYDEEYEDLPTLAPTNTPAPTVTPESTPVVEVVPAMGECEAIAVVLLDALVEHNLTDGVVTVTDNVMSCAVIQRVTYADGLVCDYARFSAEDGSVATALLAGGPECEVGQ